MTDKILRPDPERYVVSIAEIEAQIAALRTNADALHAAGNRADAPLARGDARALEHLLCIKGSHKVVDGRCVRCREMV